MIQRPYELVQDFKTIFRFTVEGETTTLNVAASMIDGWLVTHELNRESILELRDICDGILQDWFCPDKPKTLCPICEREYHGIVPIVFDPADVGRLDMGEVLAGRETGQVMQGEDEQQLNVTQTHDRPCTDYYCRTCYPDKKGITPADRSCVEDAIEEARRTA